MFDAAYEEQRRIYTTAMDASMTAISRDASRRLSAHRRTTIVAVCVAAALAEVMTVVDKHRRATEESLSGRSSTALAREAVTAEEEVDMAYLAQPR